MENLKFPESWEKAKQEVAKKREFEKYQYSIDSFDITYAIYIGDIYTVEDFLKESAQHMAEAYEARIAELEKQLIDQHPDTEADGLVFCGKCGHQK